MIPREGVDIRSSDMLDRHPLRPSAWCSAPALDQLSAQRLTSDFWCHQSSEINGPLRPLLGQSLAAPWHGWRRREVRPRVRLRERASGKTRDYPSTPFPI